MAISASPGLSLEFQSQGALSFSGRVLFIVTLLLAASANPALRVNLGGLTVHPYLGFLMPFALFLWPRCLRLPPSLLFSSAVFFGLYSLSCFVDPATLLRGVQESVKLASSFATMFLVAAAVRSRTDFTFGACGVCLSVAAISVVGLRSYSGSMEGVNPMVGIGNRNAFSLYALPAILLGAAMAVQKDRARMQRLLLLLCTLVTTMTVFSTSNRSGWVGVAFIFAVLFLRRLDLRLIVVAALAFGAIVQLMEQLPAISKSFNLRVKQSNSGYTADDARLQLVNAAFHVGMENPILGVGPQNLPRSNMVWLGLDRGGWDAHNLPAAVFGGSGLFAFLAYLIWIAALWHAPAGRLTGHRADAQFLLRVMLLLWIFRGMFSREVLFAPAFFIAFGLLLGLRNVAELIPRRQTEAGLDPVLLDPLCNGPDSGPIRSPIDRRAQRG